MDDPLNATLKLEKFLGSKFNSTIIFHQIVRIAFGKQGNNFLNFSISIEGFAF